MNHRFSSLKQILDLLAKTDTLSITEMSEITGKSRVILHRYLKSLFSDGKVQKVGLPPHTRYTLNQRNDQPKGINEKIPIIPNSHIPFLEQKILNDIFYKLSPTGEIYEGFHGFEAWCTERGYELEKSIKNYLTIYKHIESLKDSCGLVPVEGVFGTEFDRLGLDAIFYADQYKWMEFGRGKLAEMTFYAKQSQEKKLIQAAIDAILPQLLCLISREKFDAIVITPWSIERKNQLLGTLKKNLEKYTNNFIKIIKYSKSGIIIPQKSLKHRNERIQNAQNTIFIHDKHISSYEKVLLIDDFVGSGATLNETAIKLKEEGVREVFGFAWVGNMNLSYDVINEI